MEQREVSPEDNALMGTGGVMNIEHIREDFRILNKDVIYFDSAATSLTPAPVVQAILDYYHEFNANIERGVYSFSQEASKRYEEAHSKVASFFGVTEPEIVFTKNCTYGINLVANSLRVEKGDNIVTTLLEHHSNYLPWLRLGSRYGISRIQSSAIYWHPEMDYVSYRSRIRRIRGGIFYRKCASQRCQEE